MKTLHFESISCLRILFEIHTIQIQQDTNFALINAKENVQRIQALEGSEKNKKENEPGTEGYNPKGQKRITTIRP